MFTQQLTRTYFNILIRPGSLARYPPPLQGAVAVAVVISDAASCRDVRLLILEPSRWSLVQKYRSILKGLTLDQLLTFVRDLKAELYAEGLVQGNITSTVSTHTYSL